MNEDQKRHRCQSSEQHLEFYWSDLNVFLSRLATLKETCLYNNDPETKQESMEWRHSGSPRPKFSECKNPLETLSPRFFGIKTASSPLIIFQSVKLSTRLLLISAGAIEGHFERQTRRERHKCFPVLARQCPGSPDICNAEETGLSVLPVS